ncbi:MAG TPA: NAD(P)-binding protein, partial [Steroidobacteraceae bacterium]|nr:NAD(P)-binding protein [Steroidobacteraceae bacterium]
APLRTGRLRLRNRIVHAAMSTRMVREGRVTDEMLLYYGNRARGGAALIVTEPLNAARTQKQGHRLTVWDDSNQDDLARFAELIEREDCRLLGQIQHSGRGRRERGRNPNAVGVSGLADDLSWTVPHVMSVDDIRRLIAETAEAAARLDRLGFSGLEISAGHGHLFHQFLSPWSNQREDEYGGDFDGRLRFLRELIEAIRAGTRSTFVLALKLPGDDGLPGSIDADLAGQIARAATAGGAIDYVTFCQGAHARTLDWHIPDMHWPRAPWMPLIRSLRPSLNGVPLMALGLITDPAEADGIVSRGEADLVAMGRALVTDPAWPLKAAQGREREIRYCVSCNTCWGQIIEGQRLACDNNPRVAAPDEVDWWPKRAQKPRRVVVVGSGIAGMEAAWVAAARGHEVTVLGASQEVGGKTRLLARLPGGESLSSIYDYQWLSARRAGVRFQLGERADAATVLACEPDIVVLATGATLTWPRTLPQEWCDPGLVPDARTLAAQLLRFGQKQHGGAVLFDMDHTEGTYALAQLLLRLFEHVTIVTPRERVAVDVPLVSALGIYRRLTCLGVSIVPLAELSPECDLEAGIVRYRNVYSGAVGEIREVSVLTYATPRRSETQLEAPLRAAGIDVRIIGDAFAPRTTLSATSEGHSLGNAL